jgi:peptide-methionine (R)-S-oxide reductase
MDRRMLIAATLALVACSRRASADGAVQPVVKTEAAWRQLLTSGQYDVLRGRMTEDPGTSPLIHEHRPGYFICAGCDQSVYRAEDRLEDASGWLSFSRPVPGAVALVRETGFKVQTEVRCSRCDGHQGYVRRDGPQNNERYEVSGLALMFHPAVKDVTP